MVAPAVAGALIGGGASLASSALGFAGGMMEAKKARKFQKKAMKHKYQWAVEDLRAAGLNPILAAQGGITGGGAPGGVQPHVPTPDIGGGIREGVSTAREIRAQKAEVEKVGFDRDISHATWGLVNRQKDLTAQKELESMSVQNFNKAHTAHMNLQNKMLEFGIPSARARYEWDKSRAGTLLEKWHRGSGRALGNVPVPSLFYGLSRSSARGSAKPRRSVYNRRR